MSDELGDAEHPIGTIVYVVLASIIIAFAWTVGFFWKEKA